MSCHLQDCNCCSFVLSVFHGQATLRQIWEHLDFITELPLSTSSSSTTFPWCFCDPLFWRLVLDDTAVMAFVRTHLGILDCQKKLQPTTQDNGINHYGEWSIGMNLNNSTPQLSIFINIKLINMYFQVWEEFWVLFWKLVSYNKYLAIEIISFQRKSHKYLAIERKSHKWKQMCDKLDRPLALTQRSQTEIKGRSKTNIQD